jgi:hypothetical protein
MEAAEDRTFIYHINAANQIIYLNREWIAFAEENHAPELTPEHVLGQELDRFIIGAETKQLYGMVYERVRKTRREVHIPFRCDSPHQKRFFTLRIASLLESALEFTIKVVKMERQSVPFLDNSIEHSSAFVVICSWCKRIQINDGRWVEIENAIQEQKLFGPRPPNLTHGVCPDCISTIRQQL